MAKRPLPDLGRTEIPSHVSMPTLQPHLTPREFAARLKISPKSVRQLMNEGLPYVKIGERRVRFDPIKAQEWLTKRTVGGK